MRGTGPVTIGRETVYAYFMEAGRALRLRLSADECERFDLFEGRQIRIRFNGQEPASGLVMAVAHAPPFVWVEVEFSGVVSRAG
ncbi:MAG TPA: hypothetical protein VGE74_08715 [Gemmata sp.]